MSDSLKRSKTKPRAIENLSARVYNQIKNLILYNEIMSKELNLADTRTIQDWNLKFALAKAEGVAEVASIGGFVKQYNVVLDPQRMRDRGISMEAPTGHKFCVVRVQRPGFPKNATVWE